MESVSWRIGQAIISITLTLMLLAGCAAGDLNVKVLVQKKANDNSPIRVDLVIVYNEDLFKKIRELGSKQWFQEKNRYLHGYPGEIAAKQWELIPGQVVAEETLTFSQSVTKGIIIFADYPGGDNRYILENYKPVTIILQQKGFEVRQ